MSILSLGHVSVGGGGEGASEALQLWVTASFLPGYVGGGDRRCRISGHRQDLGQVLPNLWTHVRLFYGVYEWTNNLPEYPEGALNLVIIDQLTYLSLFFYRHIFHLNPVTLMPEEEKHTLLENIEIEADEEEKKPWMTIDLASSFIFSLFWSVL